MWGWDPCSSRPCWTTPTCTQKPGVSWWRPILMSRQPILVSRQPILVPCSSTCSSAGCCKWTETERNIREDTHQQCKLTSLLCTTYESGQVRIFIHVSKCASFFHSWSKDATPERWIKHKAVKENVVEKHLLLALGNFRTGRGKTASLIQPRECILGSDALEIGIYLQDEVICIWCYDKSQFKSRSPHP